MSASPPRTRITSHQWRTGIAAWLGWLFDGLELHIYTLVATPLVVELLGVTSANHPEVKEKSAYIQAAFLAGWAIGGAFFGRLGDRLGRSRTLALTVLTYAACTGLCAFSQTWWQLMVFRFFAALGIGGEWAVGAALLSETWPKSWRPWLAAILQTGVNLGILIAASVVALLSLLPHPPANRYIFLLGVAPAVLVFWIRRSVPETETWSRAESQTARKPRLRDLFAGSVASTTWKTTVVCALSLSVWWLFIFWYPQHLRQILTVEGVASSRATGLVSTTFFVVIAVSIVGNFFSGWLARWLGYRTSFVLLFAGLAIGMIGSFIVPRGFSELAWFWLPFTGFFSGVFGLFTMYLPPLFPPLLRTTGAGFCYNVGRLAAAFASVVFGWAAPVSDYRQALLWSSGLAVLAVVASFWLPEGEVERE
jgi:MFS family permease